MTPTEIITKSRDLLIKQGEPSLSELGGCVYRTKSGLGCAVGILLSKEDATILDQMDEGSVEHILSYNVSRDALDEEYFPVREWDLYQSLSPEAKELLENNEDLLSNLQYLHDQCGGKTPDIPPNQFVEHITKTFTELLQC